LCGLLPAFCAPPSPGKGNEVVSYQSSVVSENGNGTGCHSRETLVIPAKAGIHAVDLRKCAA